MSKPNEVDTQKLPCKLTPEGRDRKTHDLVLLEQDEAKKKAAKKACVAEMNAQLKQVRAQIDERVKELADGEEVREVEVEARFDYEAKRVDYVRRDTGDVVQSREMDAYDLQERLPGTGDQDVLPPPAKPQKRRKRKHGELTDLADDAS